MCRRRGQIWAGIMWTNWMAVVWFSCATSYHPWRWLEMESLIKTSSGCSLAWQKCFRLGQGTFCLSLAGSRPLFLCTKVGGTRVLHMLLYLFETVCSIIWINQPDLVHYLWSDSCGSLICKLHINLCICWMILDSGDGHQHPLPSLSTFGKKYNPAEFSGYQCSSSTNGLLFFCQALLSLLWPLAFVVYLSDENAFSLCSRKNEKTI